MRRDADSALVSATSRSAHAGTAATRERTWGAIARTALVLVALAVAAWFVWRRPASESTSNFLATATFARLTDQPGLESFPSLSPDGKSIVYSSAASGNLDLYLQRVEGRNTTNLTADSPADDTQPAFSPDGTRIAFRSERGGGGIFVMGATGETVRRLSDVGYNPSWSPDGRFIVCAQETIEQPTSRYSNASALWVIDVSTGQRRQVTVGDAVQPSWSPHGHRIAYWAADETGQRDLWTVPAQGGAPAALTNDRFVDWSPIWSPDGRYLFFSSDRGGSMNLWRVALDETSGRVRGRPERVTTPAAFAHHACFARDKGTLAYVSTSVEQELQRVAFDPRAARATGEPQSLSRDLRRPSFPDVSPDGEWVVYSQTEPQEDLLLSRLDGSGRRALTNDAARDRRPRFSPDGTRIAFYSDRGGSYEVWTISRDGGDLRQLTRDPKRRNARHPAWSPDGTRLFFSRTETTGEIVAADHELDAPALVTLPPFVDPAFSFAGVDWSPDGGTIAGTRVSGSGERVGIAVYDLALARYESLTDFGMFPEWMSDSRRLVFAGASPSERAADLDYPRGDSLFVVDRITRRVSEVLSQPEAALGYPSLSPDGRTLLFVRRLVKADVWTLTSNPAP
jgi:Tol biopolymer transport system component